MAAVRTSNATPAPTGTLSLAMGTGPLSVISYARGSGALSTCWNTTMLPAGCGGGGVRVGSRWGESGVRGRGGD